GIAFMMMNLSKYWNRRWSKDQFSLFKNKNREKKRPIKLKLRVELIVFQYLRVGYFPDTCYLIFFFQNIFFNFHKLWCIKYF
ncbi:hypothetical protein WCV20_07760, partial [Lactobacillus helveticus]